MDTELPDKIETASGDLYKPRAWGWQGLCLLCVFLAGPAIGWCIAIVLGGLSDSAATFLYLPFPIILFLGYGLWIKRLKVIAFECLGKGILWTLLKLLFKRQKPESLKDLLPSQEKLEEMAVRAQKAASSFSWVAFPIGFFAGLIVACFNSHTTRPLQMALTVMVCLAWGHVLSTLGRRGYLPIMDDSGA